MRDKHEPVVGTVQSWSDDHRWGVLTTPDGLSVFCHFADVDLPGHRRLEPGARSTSTLSGLGAMAAMPES